MVQILQILACLSVLALRASASPIDSSLAIEERYVNAVVLPRVWPKDSSAERRRGETQNNAERMKRGMPILAPAKLYDPARVHAAPAARLSQNPAPPSSAHYHFAACYSAVSGTIVDTFTAASDQEAVNRCDTDVYGPSSGTTTRFSIQQLANGQYACAVDLTVSSGPEACTATDYALYNVN